MHYWTKVKLRLVHPQTLTKQPTHTGCRDARSYTSGWHGATEHHSSLAQATLHSVCKPLRTQRHQRHCCACIANHHADDKASSFKHHRLLWVSNVQNSPQHFQLRAMSDSLMLRLFGICMGAAVMLMCLLRLTVFITHPTWLQPLDDAVHNFILGSLGEATFAQSVGFTDWGLELGRTMQSWMLDMLKWQVQSGWGELQFLSKLEETVGVRMLVTLCGLIAGMWRSGLLKLKEASADRFALYECVAANALYLQAAMLVTATTTPGLPDALELLDAVFSLIMLYNAGSLTWQLVRNHLPPYMDARRHVHVATLVLLTHACFEVCAAYYGYVHHTVFEDADTAATSSDAGKQPLSTGSKEGIAVAAGHADNGNADIGAGDAHNSSAADVDSDMCMEDSDGDSDSDAGGGSVGGSSSAWLNRLVLLVLASRQGPAALLGLLISHMLGGMRVLAVNLCLVAFLDTLVNFMQLSLNVAWLKPLKPWIKVLVITTYTAVPLIFITKVAKQGSTVAALHHDASLTPATDVPPT